MYNKIVYLIILIVLFTFKVNPTNANFSHYFKLYDDSFLTSKLDDLYPYLKFPNGSYIAPRDYFNFNNIFEPNKDYYEQVNIERHLYEEFRAMEIAASIATLDQWHYSDEVELIESGWPEANPATCKSDLRFILNETRKAEANSSYLFSNGFKNIQFLRFIDCWARPPSATYLGHSYWLGSYRGCKLAKLKPDESASRELQFEFCWAKLKPLDWPEVDEMRPPISFRSALCLPRSCDTKLANENKQLVYEIMTFNFSPLHRNRFKEIIDIYCLPKPKETLSESSRYFLLFLAIWISAILILSLLDLFNLQLIQKNRWLRCLLLSNNLQIFMADDSPPSLIVTDSSSSIAKTNGYVDLRPLGLLRVFGCSCVVFGHCLVSLSWVFNVSTLQIIESRRPGLTIGLSFFKTMDLFFVLGGLTAAYSIRSKFSSSKQLKSLLILKNYLAINIVRFVRLAPMSILIISFIKSLYIRLSDGPMWDYGTYKHSVQGACQRSSWWRVLLFPIIFDFESNNTYFNECLLVSWYLITDMKVFFIVPILIYLISSVKSGYYRILIVTISICLSCLNQYKDLTMQQLVYFNQFFKYGAVYVTNILSLTFGESGYFSVITRQSSVVLGLLAGIYVHEYKQARCKSNRWPFWMKGWYFKFCILWQIYDFISPALIQAKYLKTGQIPSDFIIILTNVFKTRLDSIMFTIISLRLTTDLASSFMVYSKPFYKLSKLTYCVYLIHPIIISYVLSSHEYSRPNSSFWELIIICIFVTTLSFIISFPLYILFESPFCSLANILLKVKKKTTSEDLNSTSQNLQNQMIEAKQIQKLD